MQPILRIAIDTPVGRHFDYLPPAATDPTTLSCGVRVQVPFGRRTAVGVLVGIAATTEVDPARMRRAHAILDLEPVFDAELLSLLQWASHYYHHPPGAVCAAALPVLLRRGRSATEAIEGWRLSDAGRVVDPQEILRRAPRQAALLHLLADWPDGADAGTLAETGDGWRSPLGALMAKGLVSTCELGVDAAAPAGEELVAGPPLTAEQASAAATMRASLGSFRAHLLDGVTGSGKTEVYLQVIADVLRAGQQTLVLVPEIGLTPQLLARFRRRFSTPLAVLHSQLSDTARLAAWRSARDGSAGVVIGTRSAVFAPLLRPGLIVVDEEHDASLKQQEGFRYSARDLAVMRASRLGIPVVLGSATPALETLHNALGGRYSHLVLPERPGATTHPAIRLIDLRVHKRRDGLAQPLLTAIGRHLDNDGQALIFLNRRGYAPAWFCADCGWSADCQRCDAKLTYHRHHGSGKSEGGLLRCHHCASEARPPAQCPVCGGATEPAGQGTERVEEALREHFPDVPLLRIDRDSTRRRGQIEELLGQAKSGECRILVGTQMLTKGHHFPELSLVGVLNADQGLFGTDFRSNERLAQIIVQVAGRAGRAEKPGEVFIQTSHPEHALLQRLVREGYGSFARAALEEREAARWPPYSSLALLRAESPERERALRYLEEARDCAREWLVDGVQLLGPAAAPMERRAGRFRAQLLAQASERNALRRFLAGWTPALASLPSARKVRWSIDVDPQEMF